ncbi:Stk1 family PASTA domain-containing Ser/Thr kinase [Nanchangia anserum]|uniref:non-specific serine/threonine protein kinase n=1 Tax=Nanchangia anserum TaxID=2692125 RepID=A0A8I0GDF8_9ACTO|nr:Stk1 family PASTA domain-containing Ser/Thr kinase [Nanchangia anserum]MBD3688842.1 Stk1 family PASTA domain-containing Ser/Thr kinase [Nanchangia anserum]QOX81115.1 Stk1 family PASTA domain-containing Ser/Thr kinase [Nanchangia anserum]
MTDTRKTTPVPAADPLVGTLVDGRYRVDSFLAAGGMASVYRAHDTRLGRDVALKVIHPHLALDPALAERFIREASAAAQLHHPGIVAIHDQGDIDGRGYFVMELVDGHNLRTELITEGALSLGDALDIVEAILTALAAAHRRGIVHRDIKPENVLLTPEREVKVADFGLAHAVSAATGTTTGTVMGTVAYLAPEVVSRGTSDAAADIYSTGILLYELLTGEVPYADEPPIRIAWHHVNDALPLPSDSQEWIPTEVDEFVAALTATDPAARLADGTAALAELRRLRRAIGTSLDHLRAPRVAESGPQVTTRMPTEVAPHALPSAPAAAASSRRPRTRSRRRILVAVLIVFLIAAAATIAWWFLAGPGARVAVPDVAGMSPAQAERRLSALDLETTRDVEYSDTVEAGDVTRTDPTSGTKVKKHARVRIYVSQGVHMVNVPKGLEGKNRDDVEAALAKVPLAIGDVSEEYSNDVAEGLLIRLSPEPGTSLAHDSRIDLVFSKGREPQKIPPLTGLARADAEKALADSKLGVSVVEAFSDTVEKGHVISQQPVAGAGGFTGDVVTITVSKGPEVVTVPNVRGMSMDEATSRLEALGLRVTTRKRLLGLDPNHVYDQSPSAGTSVKVGSTITLDYV